VASVVGAAGCSGSALIGCSVASVLCWCFGGRCSIRLVVGASAGVAGAECSRVAGCAAVGPTTPTGWMTTRSAATALTWGAVISCEPANSRDVWRWTVYGISSGGMEESIEEAKPQFKETFEVAGGLAASNRPRLVF